MQVNNGGEGKVKRKLVKTLIIAQKIYGSRSIQLSTDKQHISKLNKRIGV